MSLPVTAVKVSVCTLLAPGFFSEKSKPVVSEEFNQRI